MCESRSGRPGLPVPNSPYGLCRRKATLNLNFTVAMFMTGLGSGLSRIEIIAAENVVARFQCSISVQNETVEFMRLGFVCRISVQNETVEVMRLGFVCRICVRFETFAAMAFGFRTWIRDRLQLWRFWV